MSNDGEEKDRVWREHVAPGVYVETYDDGSVGIDKAALANRIENKIDQKVGQWTCGCVAQLLSGIILIMMVVGFGVFFWFNQDQLDTIHKMDIAPGAGPKVTSWDGRAPLACSGNDTMTITGVDARLAGQTVIQASSNCTLTIVNSNLHGAVGIQSRGNASVTMSGGSLGGSIQAVDAAGNSEVVLQGVQTSGGRASSGNAEIRERR